MQYHSEIDAPLCGILWTCLRSAEILPVSGIVDIDAARARLGPVAHFQRWLDESLRVLSAEGYLHVQNGTYRVNSDQVKARSDAEMREDWKACLNRTAATPNAAIAALADRALDALPDILTGRTRATDVLFPGGSTELVEGVYKGNPIVDYFNNVIADLTVAIVEERRALDPDAKLRIIEIGAGTGGTSACILERLQAYAGHIEDYCYTDLSQAFLMHARETFGPENSYLSYQIYNIEKPISEQKIVAGSYDIAIATNVVHATSSIAKSLRNIKATLRTNGVLLLNEINRNSLLMHLTFGLLEGWWLYEDDTLRIPGCPALTPQSWKAVLKQEGYRSILFPAQNAHNMGNQIIAAESNGIVRKKRQPVIPQRAEQEPSHPTQLLSMSDQSTMRELVNNLLLVEVSNLLKLPVDEIDLERELSSYGVDSIGFSQFAREINTLFKVEITPTVFYETFNIDSLSQYLIKNYYDAVQLTLAQAVDTQSKLPAFVNNTSLPNSTLEMSLSEEAAVYDYDAPMGGAKLIETVLDILVDAVADYTKMDRQDIEVDEELSIYGFDSIGFANLARLISDKFNAEVAPTVFYENLNLSSIAQYLIRDHGQQVGRAISKLAERAPISEISQVRPQSTLPVVDITSRSTESDSIAVIGMSAKFPKAEDVEEYWRNVINSKDCISEIPQDRWDWKAIFGETKEGNRKTKIKWGGFIEGMDEFDPGFFGLTEDQAKAMDPRIRLLLMHTWKAVEDAGYAASKLAKSNTATFFGLLKHDGYADLIREAEGETDNHELDMLSAMSAANWVNYFFDFRGRSETVEAACSSGIVAIDQAVKALRDETCDLAVVGGANALLTSDMHVSLGKYGILSEDGHCKTFSKDADGFVRSEGVGVLVLKRTKEAERDGNHIYGVVLGGARNHNGRTQSIMAPNPNAQSGVVIAAHQDAQVDSKSVTYIEMHGTGTALGDSIEVKGVQDAYKELIKGTPLSNAVPWCGLGSVKGYIGHLEPASGIASAIKILMQFRDEMLIKNPYADNINPYIQLDETPFYILKENQRWRRLQGDTGQPIPLRAGISAFGAGGVNAHVVLEEYVPKETNEPLRLQQGLPVELIVLSARSKAQLKEQVILLLADLEKNRSVNFSLRNVAHTLQVGRDAMEYRLGVEAWSLGDLATKLRAYLEMSEKAEGVHTGKVLRGKVKPKSFDFDARQSDATAVWKDEKLGDAILEFWVAGGVIDWDTIFERTDARLVPLPTYPFAKGKYWVGQQKKNPSKPTRQLKKKQPA